MTQAEALQILKMGHNVFLTGQPGAGKTYLLNQYIAILKKHKIEVAVTASTGIAATHIGGTTIHSWSGVGIKKNLNARQLDDLLDREYLVKRISKTEVLIIDEVSMLDAVMLDDINNICKIMRRSEEPFGGLQMVLVGDFFQLPPINRTGEPIPPAYASKAWQEARMAICYLSEQYRQKDGVLNTILKQIRENNVEQDMYDELLSTTSRTFDDGIEPVRLFTHNADVDQLNNSRLAELDTEIKTFGMTSKGKDNHVERLVKSCLSPEHLQLKEGAIVMCTKNNFELGYVNGTMGKVIAFDSKTKFPIIETTEEKRFTITPAEWAVEDNGKLIASIEQIPLRLAWAITVHKSQGMSIDRAEIDLSQTFEYGQGYVALSRLRDISGLRLLGLNDVALQVNPEIMAADNRFLKLSDAARSRLGEFTEEDLTTKHQSNIVGRGGVLKPSKEDAAKPQKTASREKTMNLVLQKKTIEDMATERSLTKATVMNHIEDLLRDNRLSQEDIAYLRPTTKKFAKDLEKIRKAFGKADSKNLGPAKGILGDAYDFDEIRFFRLFL